MKSFLLIGQSDMAGRGDLGGLGQYFSVGIFLIAEACGVCFDFFNIVLSNKSEKTEERL